MIIIYNLSGLILAGAGIVTGLFVFMLTGWFSPGLLTLAVIWFAGGLWWRNQELPPGVKRPFPALFFIPLPFLAVPVASVAVLGFLLIEWGMHTQPRDPRAERFRADERMLESAAATGDVQLAQKILTALPSIPVQGKSAGPNHVATRNNGDAILVLVKAPALKSYSDDVRRTLLLQIADILQADEQSKGKRIFIGIKGRLTYGAVQTPPNAVEIGSVVNESKLYDFYDDAAVPGSVALAGSPPGGKKDFPMDIRVPRSPSDGSVADAAVGPAGPLGKESNRLERERPNEDQRAHDALEAVASSENKTAPRAEDDGPDAARLREDNASPRAKTAAVPAEQSADDKAAARAKKKEDAQAERARQASKREAERAERKQRSDERMAELKKRSDERLAELQKRSDEQLATSMLDAAESQRKVGTTRDYRKRLKEIVDKYPETEAGKKAKKNLK
ncbi:MAG TPA: hypothetical protein VGM05_06470 [Planctomycetaceae bacterium]|jgi:hypothetical protein